ncbi:MAG: tRNA (adenosine(37)-N6)-threonylcarbamoyltransferase complex dimerization subunit type 1 TsaB [Cryomorphaceae bacterium]|nr:tRNA (adenosine(37)-N6)-threonylcarbamoyltransferase complex dimerization subunit type 1 TsaB [Cryomorphaceae bacterium]
MSLILNLETSSKNCSVSLSSKGKLIDLIESEDENYRHSEILTTSIKDILSKNNLNVKSLDAISVGIGPGSFTGLRIGLSVSKGLCYPHNINLIGISTLKILANSVNPKTENIVCLINDKGNYFYMSKYNSALEELISPKVQLVDEEFLDSTVNESTTIVVNTESAYSYVREILNKEGDLTKSVISSSKMIELSQQAFDNKIFEDLAYVEPMYVKKPYVN